MTTKHSTLSSALVGFIVAFIGLTITVGTANAADRKLLVMGTAPAGSSAFPFMVGVSTLVNKAVPSLALTAQETGGSVSNLRLLDEGTIHMSGFASTAAVAASEGKPPFKKKRKVALLMSMYQQTYLYFAPKKTGIKSWKDAAGKKLVVGSPGGSTRLVGTLIAKLTGMDTKAKLLYLRPGGMMSALHNDTADAGFGLITGSSMDGGLTEALATMDINVYSADDATIAKVIEMTPGLNRAEVPDGLIKGKGAFSAVGENLLMGSSLTLADEDAYSVVKAVYENYARMSKYTKTVKGQKRDSMVAGFPPGISIHPGAAKFYKEVGLLK